VLAGIAKEAIQVFGEIKDAREQRQKDEAE